MAFGGIYACMRVYMYGVPLGGTHAFMNVCVYIYIYIYIYMRCEWVPLGGTHAFMNVYMYEDVNGWHLEVLQHV